MKHPDEEKAQFGAVFYTDGGCRPSRGIGGWGVHGYTYRLHDTVKDQALKEDRPTESGYVTVPDDYAALSKHQVVKPVLYYDGYGSQIPESTNNIAELTAAVETFQLIAREKFSPSHIVMDSQYVLDGINGRIKDWSANNWLKQDGEPPKNLEHWQQLHAAIVSVDEAGLDWSTSWIKGHLWLGNIQADRNATRGIIQGRKGVEINNWDVAPVAGYWNPKSEYNRFFAHSRWYFNTNVGGANRTKAGRWIYYCGHPGDDSDGALLGKRMSDVAYSVLYLSEPEPVLESVRDYADQVLGSNAVTVAIGRLDHLFNKEVYQDLAANGCAFVQKLRPDNNDLFDIKERLLVKDARPPKLTFRAVETIAGLERTLEQFLDDPVKYGIIATDITDQLYLTEEVKNKAVVKLHSNVGPTTKAIKPTVGYNTGAREGSTTVTLTLGLDLPKRNSLSGMAADSVKVSVLTWRESDKAFRYATVVETDQDCGIWANVYTNLRVLSEKD